VTSAFSAAMASISEMKSGLPAAAWVIRSRRSWATLSPINESASSGVSGSSRSVPGQPGRRSTSSGRAMHRSRAAGREQRRRLDQVEERRRPIEVTRITTSGASSAFPKCPGDLVPARPDADSPRSGGSPRPRPIRWQSPSFGLNDRSGDALPYGRQRPRARARASAP
jgi:hypothetical protein